MKPKTLSYVPLKSAPPRRPNTRLLLIIAAAVVLVAALGAGAWQLLGRRTPTPPSAEATLAPVFEEATDWATEVWDEQPVRRSPTPTRTRTATPTRTQTPTRTLEPTRTPTRTPMPTYTPFPTFTPGA